jgi:hypothetical protein
MLQRYYNVCDLVVYSNFIFFVFIRLYSKAVNILKSPEVLYLYRHELPKIPN